ncbi:MAG: urease accessory protein UreF [Trebonia sp.]
MTASIAALLLADGRLPVGGHAHSAGLEPAVDAGLTADRVPDYLRARLMTVGRMEAAATVLSHRWAGSAGKADSAGLRVLQDELLARTPSAPMREASGQLGRGLARLVQRLWPQALAVRGLRALDAAPQRPVALGVATALTGMDERHAARACLYDDAQTVASAALKLLPIDPLEPVGWLLTAASMIDAVTEEAVKITEPAALPAVTAPLIEQWSLTHYLNKRRIFRA